MNFLKWIFGSPSDEGSYDEANYIDDDADMLLLSQVGAGSFGSVSLIKQESTGKLFAAKKSLLDGVDLASEISSCLSVNHRNVAKAFPYYYDDGEGAAYILTDFIEGPSLLNFIEFIYDADIKLSVEETAWIGREIALGLHAIHRQGLVHRDLSFNNIILSQGRPVIIDFGLAKESLSKATGTLCGTPDFIAPEVGFSSATPLSDIFSVGALLYWLHFQHPLRDSYGRGIGLDLRFRKKGSSKEEPLFRIIEKAISLNPRERHSTAFQLAAELKPLADRVAPDWWWGYHSQLYECCGNCASCDNPLPGRAAYCPYCGEDTEYGGASRGYPTYLAPYPCSSCEGMNSVNWTYCQCCGEELE